MDDILDFASSILVDNARLALWMPTANDEDAKLTPPSHPCLGLLSSSKQPFNKCMSLVVLFKSMIIYISVLLVEE